jgi:hypothetical protein
MPTTTANGRTKLCELANFILQPFSISPASIISLGLLWRQFVVSGAGEA